MEVSSSTAASEADDANSSELPTPEASSNAQSQITAIAEAATSSDGISTLKIEIRFL